MALSMLMGLMALAALPGALGSEESSSNSSVTVCLLLLLLLILMVGLALAWYHLSRESEGYYHPTRLGNSLWHRARRLLRATGVTRWLRGSSAEELQDSMEKEDKDEEEEEEDPQEDWEDREKPEPEPQKDKDAVPTSPQDPEAAQGEDCLKQGEGSAPEPQPQSEQEPDAKAKQEPEPKLEPTKSGGTVEALLSDLHAFSGSAAWDDGAGAEGSPGLSVTAL